MVVAGREHLHVVQEEDSSKRRQILDGARKVFMDLGFDGASMGEIARAAQVSKGTLYVYFADKCALFEAILEQEALQHGQVVFNFDPARDAETTLKEFGQAYIHLLCRPGGGSAIRTVMAIAERMPDVGRRYYLRVLDKTINRLSEYLKIHVALRRSQDRRLRSGGVAVHGAVQGLAVLAVRSSRPRPAPSEERITAVVDSATRMFLAAYGRRSGGGPRVAQSRCRRHYTKRHVP
jgi:AcrR family transcriptional regulator